MKRVYLIFIMNSLIFCISNAQTLIEQVERAYSALDSTSYIDNIVLSYSKSLEKEHEETFKSFVDICSSGVDSSDIVQKQHIADSIYLRYFKDDITWNDQEVKKFANEVRAGTPLYVLNLKLKDKQTLQVDTSRLAFNLFYFDKRCKGRLYVYCDDGEYSGLDSRYRIVEMEKYKLDDYMKNRTAIVTS